MTKTVDQWAAEACGVTTDEHCYSDNSTELYWKHGHTYSTGKFTIKDPRCCKIFRDWWLSKDTSNAVLIFNDEVTYFRDYAYGQGDPTTRDTEEACITAIYEASQ